MMRGVVFVVYSVVTVVTCGINETTYVGILAPECIKSYFRMFVTRRVPPRNYQYFHEILTRDLLELENNENGTYVAREVPFQWRIVGGKSVSITEVPYQVLYGLYCGGSLIAPDWVITAAHCKDKEKYVYVGSTYRSKAQPYGICAHFMHPLWNASSNVHHHDYDFQLVLLEKPVPVTLNSRPIAIGDVGDIKPGALVTVSGWGHLKYKQSKMQDVVRRVQVPIMASDVCMAMPLVNYRNITPRMFCAGLKNGTKDSCQGDSGGPAVVNGKLVGLVSFGVGCAMPDQPGVYSNIPVVREWIRSVTALPL